MDLFTRKQALKVPQSLRSDLLDRKKSREDVLKEEWPKVLRYVFPTPKHHSTGLW